MASRVLSTIKSRVPCRMSDLVWGIAAPVVCTHEYAASPVGCQQGNWSAQRLTGIAHRKSICPLRKRYFATHAARSAPRGVFSSCYSSGRVREKTNAEDFVMDGASARGRCISSNGSERGAGAEKQEQEAGQLAVALGVASRGGSN